MLWEVARFLMFLLLAGLSRSVQGWWSSLGDGDWQRAQPRGWSSASPRPRPPGLGRARPAPCGRPPPPLPPHNFGRWVRIKMQETLIMLMWWQVTQTGARPRETPGPSKPVLVSPAQWSQWRVALARWAHDVLVTCDNAWSLQGSQPQPQCFLATMASTHQLGRGTAGPGAEKAAAHPPVPTVTAATTMATTAATAAAAEQARPPQLAPMTGAVRGAAMGVSVGQWPASRPGPPAPGSGGPLTPLRSGPCPPPTPGSRPLPQVCTPPQLLSMAMATVFWLLCAMRPRPMVMTEEEAIMGRGAGSGDPGSSPAERSSTPTNPHCSSDPIITNDITNHEKTSAQPDQLMPKLAPSISSGPTSYELVTQVKPHDDVIFIAQIR